MKELIFLAHDPGGYDVIMPVYNVFVKEGYKAELFLSGVVGESNPEYYKKDIEIVSILDKYIKEQKQFVLVTGTSWNSKIEVEATKLCNEKNIQTVSILDYWCNYKERFKLNEEFIFPRQLFVMDELARREAVESGIPADIMKIVGQPGLDFYVGRKVKWSKNRNLLFLSQPLSDLYGNSEGYTEFDAFKGVLSAGKELGYSINIKFHPKENEKMIKKYVDYSIEGELEDICGNYDAVIGMTTMGLLQCSLMGIPVLSYEPNLIGIERCIINKLGIAKGAYSYDDLLEQLKDVNVADKEVFPFWFDGKSTERCVKELIKIAG